MSIFEQILVDIITAGVITAPIFVKSTAGTAALNVSEEALAAILQGVHQPTAAATPIAGAPTLTVPVAPGVAA